MLRMFLGFVVVSLVCGMRTHESHNASEPEAVARADLPACPCTIYEGFCSKLDLGRDGNWGVSCVSSLDALITMPWQVQCVPAKNGGMKYPCPKLLPVKCNPETVAKPCDTSALADCTADDCGSGFMLMQRGRRPRHCTLHECTSAECCTKCNCVEGSNSGCCAGTQAGEEFDLATAVSCPDKIKALAGPTAIRLKLFAQKCYFDQTDVNFGSKTFALTRVGKKKICAERCQSVQELGDAPTDVFADALAVSRECPDAALKAQVDPGVGIFAAAAVLDKTWGDCASGLIDTSAGARRKIGK